MKSAKYFVNKYGAIMAPEVIKALLFPNHYVCWWLINPIEACNEFEKFASKAKMITINGQTWANVSGETIKIKGKEIPDNSPHITATAKSAGELFLRIDDVDYPSSIVTRIGDISLIIPLTVAMELNTPYAYYARNGGVSTRNFYTINNKEG